MPQRRIDVDVFIGGPIDGVRTPMKAEQQCVEVFDSTAIYDRVEHEYDGAIVTFWQFRGMTTQQAMTRLLLHYQPPQSPQP